MTTFEKFLTVSCVTLFSSLADASPSDNRSRKVVESILALNGGVDSGGGNLIHCARIGEDRVTLADVYFSTRKTSGLRMFEFMSQEELEEVALSTLNDIEPGLGTEATKALGELDFDYQDRKLKALHDHQIKLKFGARLFGRCQVRQLAVQDRPTGEVVVSKPYFDSLPKVEKAFLRVHEALIRVWFLRGHPVALNPQVRRLITRVFDSSTLTNRAAAVYFKTREREDVRNWRRLWQAAVARSYLRVNLENGKLETVMNEIAGGSHNPQALVHTAYYQGFAKDLGTAADGHLMADLGLAKGAVRDLATLRGYCVPSEKMKRLKPRGIFGRDRRPPRLAVTNGIGLDVVAENLGAIYCPGVTPS